MATEAGPRADPAARRWDLLGSGRFLLRVEESALPSARRWIPRLIGEAAEPEAGGEGGMVVDLVTSTTPLPPPEASPRLLQLGSVEAWPTAGERRVELRGADPRAGGSVDPGGGAASLQIPPAEHPTLAAELEAFTLLTIASALLLSAEGMALLHAAAVVDPEGRAWLLIGDAHAGKTTTTVNLVRAGFGFLSDDQVVVSAGDGSIIVSGWPRTFHVDQGWSGGRVTGRRVDFAPEQLASGRWRRSAPLAGLFFPSVAADEPTRASPLSAASALTRLIRQTPWFVTDPLAAPRVLALLREACLLPAFELRLGLDSYADPALLRRAIGAG